MNKVKDILTVKNIVIAALFLALMVFPLLGTSNYLIQAVLLMMLYAYWASAWNIIGGFAGQLSLGNATFIGIGAYVAIMLYIYGGVSPWIGMLVAGLVAGCMALLLGSICFRLKGSYYTLSTVALLHAVRLIMQTEESIFGFATNGAVGLRIDWNGVNFLGMQFRSKIPYYYIFLGLLILCLIICKYILSSKMGYYLSAINTNQNAAASLGVNVMKYKQISFFTSAFLTAMGGACYAFLLSAIDPLTMFAYDLSTKVMIMAVVGGRGTMWGPLIGAFILVPVNEFFRVKFGAQLAGLSNVLYGVILMLIVLFLPKGFTGIPELVKKTLSGRKTEKKGAAGHAE